MNHHFHLTFFDGCASFNLATPHVSERLGIGEPFPGRSGKSACCQLARGAETGRFAFKVPPEESHKPSLTWATHIESDDISR